MATVTFHRTGAAIQGTTGVQNAAICSSCGGRCCQKMPGACDPHELGAGTRAFRQRLRELIQSGFYAFDCWEGDIKPGGRLSEVFYLRPAAKNGKGRVVDRSWGGECRFLSPSGCALAFPERPYSCRVLIPSISHQCATTTDGDSRPDKERAAWEWRPFQSACRAVIAQLKDRVVAAPPQRAAEEK